ncbi:MAG: hypothetical protein SOY65_00640 [Marinifilaceae bacterium]|nr:hypothetical protein [Marinifilaceae bacterium]
MMKRIRSVIISLILLVYLIIVLTFVAIKLGEVTCSGLQVAVNDTLVNSFVNQEEIMRVIKRGYGNIEGMPLLSVNKDSLERILAKNRMIKSAQVYYSLDGFLHVVIDQREPVLRVISKESYYVDKEGEVMPLSTKFTSRVVVATGNVTKEFASKKLYPFVMMIRENEFWNAYIEQIVVRQNEDIVLIPKVGNFQIVLGQVDGADARMEKLMLFLKRGIAKKGWNRYKEVNLKFKNQIVCVRK